MTTSSLEQAEITKFNSFANDWWNPAGKLRTLHAINPLRMQYIERFVTLPQQHIIDVGCGGGILSESLATKAARVVGIDLADEALSIARAHAKQTHLTIDYRCLRVEEAALQMQQTFDVVCCFELLEHVDDPLLIIKACAQLVKPQGHVFFATLNRTLKAYLMAIIGAEYLTDLLPRGTHHYEHFIKPAELAKMCRAAHLTLHDITGVHYNPLTTQFSFSDNYQINYLVHCQPAR